MCNIVTNIEIMAMPDTVELLSFVTWYHHMNIMSRNNLIAFRRENEST
jgi:hypothetical protein